jgi:hypothetical protein
MTTRPTDEEMVTEVLTWLDQAQPEDQKYFKECERSQLHEFHHTDLGRGIRNHFKLWEYMWMPVLQEGIDCSEEHPDAISMRVVEKVWDAVNHNDQL